TGYGYDGEMVSMVAAGGGLPGSADAVRAQFHQPHRPAIAPEWPVVTKTVHRVVDVETDPSCSAEFRRIAAARGFRSFLAVPMLRGEDPLGLITVGRAQVGSFSSSEIALLQTFANQAVIAVENARLLSELQARNADLTDSLARQTATSEILRTISDATTDAQPVFEAIAESATRLSDALFGSVYQFDGELIEMVAQHDYPPAALEFSRRSFPARPSRGVFTGRAILERAVVH